MIPSSGGSSNFLSWYRYVEDDVSNFDMALLAGASAAGAIAIYIVAGKLTVHSGDLRGIWIPSTVALTLFAFSVAFMIPLPWQSMFPTMALLSGPGWALFTCKDGLYSKLFPPDLQATWRMGKSFLNNIQSSGFRWVFVALFETSEHWDYPWHMICVLVTGVLVATSTCVLVYISINMDPKKAIDNGSALDAFYKSDYYTELIARRSGNTSTQAAFGVKDASCNSQPAHVGTVNAVSSCEHEKPLQFHPASPSSSLEATSQVCVASSVEAGSNCSQCSPTQRRTGTPELIGQLRARAE
jgi:hypothetical protein